MKNFKGLSQYGEGGITTEEFYPSTIATTSMVENLGDGKKRKGSKTAQKNNQARPCLNCHKRNT